MQPLPLFDEIEGPAVIPEAEPALYLWLLLGTALLAAAVVFLLVRIYKKKRR